MQLVEDDAVTGAQAGEDHDVPALGLAQGHGPRFRAVARADNEDGTARWGLHQRLLGHEISIIGLAAGDAHAHELAGEQRVVRIGETRAELDGAETGVDLRGGEVDLTTRRMRRTVRPQERDVGALRARGASGEEPTEIRLGQAETRPDFVGADDGGEQAVGADRIDERALRPEATAGHAGDGGTDFAIIEVELGELGAGGGGFAGADGGSGLRLGVIGFLAARGLLFEKRGLTGGLGGRLLRASGLLRQLGARERVGGGIRRRIDPEKEIARLHLGAFGVIDGLEDAGHARPDFHLAHAFHLRRGDGLLGEVGRSDGHDGDGERAGGRRGALLAATDQGQQGGSEQKALDRKGFTYRHVCKSRHPDMARKTKAEAAQTRDRIVVCAREVFSRHGVTNTSLEEVAKEAGVTRGAVYWHFRDKADLFMAVRQQTGVLLRFPEESAGDPLRRLELGLRSALHRLAEEKAAQETYEVMLWKCEYIGAFAGVRQDLMTAGDQFLADTTALYAAAKQAKLTPPGLDPRLAAQETFCFYAGLLKLWLADEAGRALRGDVDRLIAAHVASRRRASPQKAV